MRLTEMDKINCKTLEFFCLHYKQNVQHFPGFNFVGGRITRKLEMIASTKSIFLFYGQFLHHRAGWKIVSFMFTGLTR